VSKTRQTCLAAVSLMFVGTVSGCGVAGTSFHPGIAAQVGDETVTVADVDTTASNYCSAIESQLAQSKQVLPQHFLRGGVAGLLATVAAAKQIAEQYGVEAGEQYDQKVASLQAATSTLAQEQQDAVIAVESAGTYIDAIQEAIGDQQAAQEGKHYSTAKADKVGTAAFVEWMDAHDVQIDPQFGMEIKDGQAVQTDTSISFPVGDSAKFGQADQPDQTYAAGLPDAHRCGG